MTARPPRNSLLDRVLLEQTNVVPRLVLLRWVLGVSVAVLATFGPFGDFFGEQPDLYQPRGLLTWLPPLSAMQLASARWLTVGFALLLAMGFLVRVSCVVTAALFFLLNGYTSAFSAPTFNYDTHLNVFLILLCLCEGRVLSPRVGWRRAGAATSLLRSTYGSFVLGAMQLYVALLYGQAFLAKLLIGGPAWFFTGDVVMLHTLRMGSAVGRWLCQLPGVFPALGVATGVFELTVGWALLRGGRLGAVAALSAMVFHLGTWLVLGISFWHLVVLLPPLFIVGVRQAAIRPSEGQPLSGKLAATPPPPTTATA
jgi:hypothetical protein